jgi:histidyl-tRNA synthetase
MGIERLLALIPSPGDGASPDVYLVNQGERAERYAFSVAEALRDAGISVVQHCGGGSFKSQMKKADGSGAPVAVIVGDEEAQAGEASVKALREERAQLRVSLDRLPDAVAGLLFGDTDDDKEKP